MKSFFLFLGLLVFGMASAQQDMPRTPFVRLKSGITIIGQNLEYDQKIFGADKIRLDTMIFKSRQVSMFKNNDGLVYGRLHSLVPAAHQNKNFYFFREIRTSYTPASGVYGGGSRSGHYSTQTVLGYSYGLGEIKSITGRNLKQDIKNDPPAEFLVDRAISYRRTSQISILVGIAGLIVPFGLGNDYALLAGTAVFFAGGLTSLIFYNKKNKAVRQAVLRHTGFAM